MDFPKTPELFLTERIMQEVRKRTDARESTKLDTARYNRIFEAVYDTIVLSGVTQSGGG